MDIQSFIQSGLLESYVLGQATAEERSLVERMLIQHTEARTELAAIEQAMESYAKALSTPPPPWMKGRILDQIAQMLPSAAPLGMSVPRASTITLRTFQVLAVLLLLAGAFLWNRNNQLRNENAAQQAQLADCTRRSENRELLYAMLRHTATEIVKLDSAGNPGAMVYHNPRLGNMLNTASVVPPGQRGTYFQFWAIVRGNPLPVSMGMVQMDAPDGWQRLPSLENAEAFAISAENNPNGNPLPTRVVMSGKLHG